MLSPRDETVQSKTQNYTKRGMPYTQSVIHLLLELLRARVSSKLTSFKNHQKKTTDYYFISDTSKNLVIANSYSITLGSLTS